MLGAGIAILTALAWAGSSIILKSLTAKIDTLSLNTLRLWVGSVILLAFIPLSGRGADFLHTPFLPLVYVIASGIIAMAIGDSIYIESLSVLDASIAFPIAQCSFPVLTVLVAVLLLGETFTWITGAGTVLVVLGIYLIAAAGKRAKVSRVQETVSEKGVIFALMAAAAWTTAAATLKIGVTDMDAFVAAGIRIPASAIVLSLLALRRRKKGTLQFKEYGHRSIALAAAAGILTYGVAAVGYVTAIQLIGVGRTVLLTTTAPLFVLPFSILILKETPTRYTIAGTFVCVAGICLVVA
ncbi:MAG: DMT family transporter [Desulfobacterales bacterium]|nr:DMT family transporter [Desulfobacterales bacterium]